MLFIPTPLSMGTPCYVVFRIPSNRYGSVLEETRRQDARATACGAHHMYIDDEPRGYGLARTHTALFDSTGATDEYIRTSVAAGVWILDDVYD